MEPHIDMTTLAVGDFERSLEFYRDGIVEAFDEKTARAWLFGTNTRLDDQAPITVLCQATEPEQFASVRQAARQLASFEA
jgi:catechol 2,3-dioxygenase-like lactoylglutathione lyase family enzyme